MILRYVAAAIGGIVGVLLMYITEAPAWAMVAVGYISFNQIIWGSP